MISMEEVMHLRVKLLSSTALAAAAVLGVSSASAQDLGALEKRVQALEKAGGGQYVARSKKTMNLVVSGHLNQMMQFRDNGDSSGVIFSGNPQSETRFRFVGTGKVSDDINAKTVIELGETSSTNASLDAETAGPNQGNFNVRQMELALASKSIGTFSIGDSSLATDGYHSAADMSGTGIIQDSGDEGIASEETWRLAAGGASGVLLDGAFSNLDAGRTDNIAYDSPTFAGFRFQASLANDDGTNFGLRYGGDFGGVSVKAAIAHDTTRSGTADVKTINGSVGVLLPMGLSVFISAADRDNDSAANPDEDRIYAKIGYMFNATELGQTRLGLAWGQHDDRAAAGDEAERWSLAIVQVIEPLGAEVYAGYHNFSLDRPGTNFEDIDLVTAGMRISF
jgi:hypothetical protein